MFAASVADASRSIVEATLQTARIGPDMASSPISPDAMKMASIKSRAASILSKASRAGKPPTAAGTVAFGILVAPTMLLSTVYVDNVGPRNCQQKMLK
jgi:hypothetical protein